MRNKKSFIFWKVSPKGEIDIVSSRKPLVSGYSYYLHKRTAIEVSAERLLKKHILRLTKVRSRV